MNPEPTLDDLWDEVFASVRHSDNGPRMIAAREAVTRRIEAEAHADTARPVEPPLFHDNGEPILTREGVLSFMGVVDDGPTFHSESCICPECQPIGPDAA